MTNNIIRIATRKSPLALWQAREVGRQLQATHQDLQIELIKMTTQGDRILDSPLSKVGGKGLFVKELEQGMLEGRADIAVHSMKDVPVEIPEGLELPVVLIRDDPRDAFVSLNYARLEDLPEKARVGTSSLRRQCQLAASFPGYEILSLRGNVNTRLAKLEADEYDAIILAAAGLRRLGMTHRITATLSPEQSLPAIGQGAIGIECRANDTHIVDAIAALDDHGTHTRIRAERALNRRLGGGCQVPIAGYAEITGQYLHIRGLIGYPDGTKILRAEATGDVSDAELLGTQVAEDLLAQGAGDILKSLGITASGS